MIEVIIVTHPAVFASHFRQRALAPLWYVYVHEVVAELNVQQKGLVAKLLVPAQTIPPLLFDASG